MEDSPKRHTKFTKLEILEIKDSDISDYLKNKILDEILKEEKEKEKEREKKERKKEKEIIILSSPSTSTTSEEEETKKFEVMTSSSELEKSHLKEIYENAIMKKPLKSKLLKNVNSEDIFILLRTYQSQLDNFFIPSEKNTMKWIINVPEWKKTIIDAWKTHILFIYKIEKVHFFDKLLWESSFQAIRFLNVKNDRHIARLIRFDSKQLKYSEMKDNSTQKIQMKQFNSKIITLYWTIIVGAIKSLIPIENIKSNFEDWYNEESNKMEDTSGYVKCDYNEESYYNCELYSRPLSLFKKEKLETKDLFYGEIENFLFDSQSFSSENIYKDKPVFNSIFHMDFYNNDVLYIFKRLEITEEDNIKSYLYTKYISGIEIFCTSFVHLNFIVLDVLEELGLSNVFKFETPSSNSWINMASQRYENLLIEETKEYVFSKNIREEEEEEEGKQSEIKIMADNYVHEYVILLRKYLHLYLDMRLYLESKFFNVPEKIPNVYIDMKNVFWPIKSNDNNYDIDFKITKLSKDHSTRIAYLMNFSQNQFSSFPMIQAYIYGSTNKLLETMHKKGEFHLAKVKKEENILPSLKEKKNKFQKKESKVN